MTKLSMGGGSTAGGSTAGGSTGGGSTAGGSTAGGATGGGSTAGGSTAGGATAGGSTAGGSAGGSTDGGSDAGATDGGFTFDAGQALVELDGGVCFAVVRSCALEGPNLLINSDFEYVADAGTSGDGIEGVLPSPWQALQVTPDTYTTDGGFGIAPSAFGNFDGVTAHSGERWVAAWSSADERGGQPLVAPLVAGRRYLARSWLHQAVRPDLNNPGTYVLMLAEPQMSNSVDLGNWCPTTSVDAGWVQRSFTFIAPDAGNLTWFNFRPEGSSGGSAYPGLDDFTVHDVTDCPP